VGVTIGQWLILAVAGLLVGITKTSVSGLGTFVVMLFAFVFPAKESTASTLFLLLAGDVLAVSLYHSQADWKLIRGLLPAVLPGIAAGALFMRFVDNKVMLIGIGSCIAATLIVQAFLRLRARKTADAAEAGADNEAAPNRALIIGTGVMTGFVTLVGNAAAAVMSLYLLVTHTEKTRFVASSAWFYLIVNVVKVPFIVSLGIVNWRHVAILGTLVPLVVVAGLLGKRFLTRLNQHQFELITLLVTIAACIVLLVRGFLA